MTSIADVRDILRGALATLFGFGGRLIARIILMVVAGHQFGAAELGVLGQVAAIVEILGAVGIMGLKRGLHNLLSGDTKNGEPVARRVLEALLISFVAAMVLASILVFIWGYLFPDRPEISYLFYFAIPAWVFTEVSLTAIKFKRVIRWDVISRCVMEPWSFLAFAVTLYFLGIIHNGLIIAYVGSLVVATLSCAVGLIQTYGFKGLFGQAPKLRNCLSIPGKSLPVGITDIGIMMFRRIDILILSLFVGHQGTGIYYMVQQIVTIPQKMNQLFEPMMSPVVAKLHHDLNARIIRLKLIGFCRWVFTLQIGLSIPLVIYADFVLGLFGPQFTAGALILVIVLFAELIDGSFALMETPLLFAKPKIPPLLIMLALGIEMTTIYFFSSMWGVTGAAIGFFTAMAVLAFTRLFMIRRHMHINIIDRSYIPPAIAALITGLALYFLRYIIPTESAFTVGFSIVAGLGGFYYLVKAFGLTNVDRILLRRVLKS
jgi:O-antigen/teichoic acid export membrane protein